MKMNPAHTFHIPVMGLAYTIDSPVKVARYGISSVMSIGEDRLIEMMRKHYHTVLKGWRLPAPPYQPWCHSSKNCPAHHFDRWPQRTIHDRMPKDS